MRAYGYRPITKELQRRGVIVNHKAVLRLLRADNLLCLRRRAFVHTTDSNHKLTIYPNLARGTWCFQISTNSGSPTSLTFGYDASSSISLLCSMPTVAVALAGHSPATLMRALAAGCFADGFADGSFEPGALMHHSD